jgi:hypothetical protein
MRSTVTLLLQAAFWVLNLLAGFVLLPPKSKFGDTAPEVTFKFTQFIIALFLGLMFLVTRHWGTREDLKKWAYLAVISLLMSVGLFLCNEQLLKEWTAPFFNTRIVIGSVYTPKGAKIAQKKGTDDPEELLASELGNAEEIWEPATIKPRVFTLSALYICSMQLFTFTLISVVQTIYIYDLPKRNPWAI